MPPAICPHSCVIAIAIAIHEAVSRRAKMALRLINRRHQSLSDSFQSGEDIKIVPTLKRS